MKFDGYRALAFKVGDEVHLISRNRKSFNDDYPILVDSLKSLKTSQRYLKFSDFSPFPVGGLVGRVQPL